MTDEELKILETRIFERITVCDGISPFLKRSNKLRTNEPCKMPISCNFIGYDDEAEKTGFVRVVHSEVVAELARKFMFAIRTNASPRPMTCTDDMTRNTRLIYSCINCDSDSVAILSQDVGAYVSCSPDVARLTWEPFSDVPPFMLQKIAVTKGGSSIYNDILSNDSIAYVMHNHPIGLYNLENFMVYEDMESNDGRYMASFDLGMEIINQPYAYKFIGLNMP